MKIKRFAIKIGVTGILLAALFIGPVIIRTASSWRYLSGTDFSSSDEYGLDMPQTSTGSDVLSAEDADTPIEDLLYEDIYVMYSGTTVLVTEKSLKTLYRDDCTPWLECSVQEIPCVDVVGVRHYAMEVLQPTLVGFVEPEIVSNRAGEFLYVDINLGPDVEDMVGQIVDLLTARIWTYADVVCPNEGGEENVGNAGGLNIIRVNAQEVPGTDGTFADKYIEFDHSQQHIYAWEQGEVVADYEVSGFKDAFAVYGVFPIVEKNENAWSPGAQKWMPWWMAFYYDLEQEAWYGLHELVYWTDADGVYHEESSENIGVKKSAGCVRLDRGEAEKLYTWTNEGDYLLIHP